MPIPAGARLGVYEIGASLGAGGPASARTRVEEGELRRGLAVAQSARTW